MGLKGLIPAAGKGVRARPYTHDIHKGMLEINGTPNLERIIRIMCDKMGISEITIVIGHLGETIRKYFGDGSRLGVSLHYVENTALEKGLAYSVFLGSKYMDGPFCMMLCDESYFGSNHSELASYDLGDALGVCAGQRVDDQSLIERNYAIYKDGKRITGLVEKPKHIDNDIMGSGTFLFSPRLAPLLEDAFARSKTGYVEFVNFLGSLVEQGERLDYFELEGTYVNINDRDSLQQARFNERSRLFNEKRVDLLIYAQGDEENLAFTVNRYREAKEIHTVYLVVPAENSVEAQITDPDVRVIRCPKEYVLYGEKIKYALGQMDGDILILTEADYSFPARDTAKLLTYLREADMVIGTRTTRKLVVQGSHMRGVVRLANIILGKLLETFWWNREARLTDVGCTFRAIWRSAYVNVQDRLSARGPEFSAEMVIELLQERQRVIEIPVNYFNRSCSLARAYQRPSTAMRFLALIVSRRLRYFFHSPSQASRTKSSAAG
ncbi:sugar phosphate nucleotidyltransferase [Desulfonatronum parangueonense]